MEEYFNIIALVLLFVLLIAAVYLIIYIHDIPYEIAKKRNHPHQDAFHVAGWVSLFLMHSIWPLLWIWAYWYKPTPDPEVVIVKSDNNDKEKQIKTLESQISSLKEQIVKLNEEKETKK